MAFQDRILSNLSWMNVGNLGEVEKGDFKIEWKIKKFSSLSDAKKEFYDSPDFYFTGESWCLRLYPNNASEANESFIGIFLMRTSSGLPCVIDCGIGLIPRDGNVCQINLRSTFTFEEKLSIHGNPKFLDRNILMKYKNELLPSDELTVSCLLKNNESNVVSESYFHRLDLMSQNVKQIYEKGIRTDCILKVDDFPIPAHRVILEARSPVFEAMFKPDTKESQSGEVLIEDCDISAVFIMLRYLYSGVIEELRTENVLQIYALADKYDIKYVKGMCVKFTLRNFSGDWFCDIFKFTSVYNEEEITRRVREYATNHYWKIIQSNEWKDFSKKYPEMERKLLRFFQTDLVTM